MTVWRVHQQDGVQPHIAIDLHTVHQPLCCIVLQLHQSANKGQTAQAMLDWSMNCTFCKVQSPKKVLHAWRDSNGPMDCPCALNPIQSKSTYHIMSLKYRKTMKPVLRSSNTYEKCAWPKAYADESQCRPAVKLLYVWSPSSPQSNKHSVHDRSVDPSMFFSWPLAAKKAASCVARGGRPMLQPCTSIQ